MIFQLFITQECNLNCTYCFEGEKKTQKMTLDMLPSITCFMKNYVKQDFIIDKEIWVNFNGGEALLEKQFIKNAVSFFEKNGINHFSISTNFTLIDNDMMIFLIDKKFTMQISIDGEKDTHDLNRKDYAGYGSFETVWRNLKKLESLKSDSQILYSMVITPKTVSNLYRNVKFLFKNNKTDVIASFNSKDVWSRKSLKILYKQAILCRKLYVKMFKKGIPVYFKPLSQNIIDFFHGFEKSTCGICKDLIGITPNGTVLACGAFLGNKFEKEFVIGTIYDRNLNNDLINQLISIKINTKECMNCVYKGRCHNDCLVCNFDCSGELEKPVFMTCYINQIFLKQSDIAIVQLLKNKVFTDYYKFEG